MASLIQGYEYDIFISYRQKDNKHDGWVTEFVENLKGELEATFKEDISVYFDENPHDRLLETHNVDKSLEDKLKCLIFIPIISQTYCDPNSYAWKYEFLPFIRMTENDHFGKDVKLRSGNVASRILPVRIHDLEQEDIKLFEKETGSVLRAMDFVFKTSSGVNRTLKVNEDHPNDNLNKTFYSDQINKVTLAVKEIILGLKTEPVVSPVKKKTQQREPLEEVKKEVRKGWQDKHAVLTKRRLISGVILLTVLIAILLTFPKIFNRDKLEDIYDQDGRISIAVIPFENWSQSEDYVHLGDAIPNEISTSLSNIEEFNIKSFTSTVRYKGSDRPSIPQIGKELGVKCIIEGTIERQNKDVSIHVQVILASNDENLWSEEFKGQWKDINTIRTNITRKIAAGLKAVLTSEEKELIGKNQTDNSDAYNLYLQGRYFWDKRTEDGQKRSLEYFEKSVELDPNYALAYVGLGDAYYQLTWYQWYPRPDGFIKAKEFALRALKLDNNLAEAHTTLGGLLCWSEWKWEDAEKELLLAIELNPDYANAHQYYSELLDITGHNEEARVQINMALELNQFNYAYNVISAYNYYHEGKFKESLDAWMKTQELWPDNTNVRYHYFYSYIRMGEDLKAVEALQKAMVSDTLTIKEAYNKSGINGILNWMIESMLKTPNPSPFMLATLHVILDQKEEALKWLEKALEVRTPGLPRINNDPDFDNLRSEPRFLAIIEKLGLSEYNKRE